jgi:hypothetical protein
MIVIQARAERVKVGNTSWYHKHGGARVHAARAEEAVLAILHLGELVLEGTGGGIAVPPVLVAMIFAWGIAALEGHSSQLTRGERGLPL